MFAVQNFIETKGVHENNVQIVKDNLRNQFYNCPLKVNIQPILML